MSAAPSSGPPEPQGNRLRQRLGHLGLAGFLFFIIKGLLWLLAPSLLVAFGMSC